MYYCEKCNAAFEPERCPVCGNKKTREPRDDDYCFLAEQGKHRSEVLMSVLDANEIPYSAVPVGTGVESIFGMSLSCNRLYVPFGNLDKANGIMREMEAEKTEELRANLLENANSFNIPPKTEKKLRKKLKLPDETDFISFCLDIVKGATKITDDDSNTGAWRFVYCFSQDYTLSIEPNRFEIYAVRLAKA